MQINRIDDMTQFDELKTTWDAIYSADPHAQIFVSWAWLRGWFEVIPYDWFILAARLDNRSPYVAFFPLRISTIRKYGLIQIRELHMGGTPAADYTGFVCLPNYEEKAITTFAVYVQQQLAWDRFYMSNVLDPRLDLFLNGFSLKKFYVQPADRISCPYIPLPDDWDQYLEDFLSRNHRKRLRRRIRQLESLDEFCMTHVQADNLERQIETLLTLWQQRWGPKPEGVLNPVRVILRRCFENNGLYLSVLWYAGTPIAALAAFVDRQKNRISDFISGWDDKFAKLSPANVLTGYSIRYAIENGFQVYDFLRGAEDYKFSFGAKERFNTTTVVTRKSLRMTMRNLIRRLRGSPARRRGDITEAGER